MPFTLAHPLAIFPFRFVPRRYISVTALVCGSIVPDMEYFLRMSPAASYSHTFGGAIFFCVPLVIIITWIWCSFLRKTLLINLPFLKRYYYGYQDVNFESIFLNRKIIFIISALTGIFSHLVWDGFSHINGMFVVKNSFLQQELNLAGMQLKMCYFIWYVSSLAGFLFILFYIIDIKALKFFLSRSSKPRHVYKFWSKVLFLTFMIALTRIALGLSWNVQRHLVIITIGAFIYALIIVSLASSRESKDTNILY